MANHVTGRGWGGLGGFGDLNGDESHPGRDGFHFSTARAEKLTDAAAQESSTAPRKWGNVWQGRPKEF